MAKRWATRRTALAALLTVPLLWLGCNDSSSGGGAAREASLASVTVSPGTLRPGTFAPDTLSYFLDLPYGTKTFTLAPTATDPSATLSVAQDGGDPAVATGSTSLDFAAPAVGGRSYVTVVVKSGAATETYGFLVTQVVGHDATLSNLAVSAGTFTPAFASGTTAYALSLDNGTASYAVTPTANDPTATITVDDGTPVANPSGTAAWLTPPAPGATPRSVKIKVTAQDGTTNKTYTVAVSQMAGNVASLSLLGDTAGAVPGFAPQTVTYGYTVPFQTAYAVTATPTSPRASVTVNGVPVANGSPAPVQLNDPPTPTVIAVEVTSQDHTTKQTYTLNVTQGPRAGLATARSVPTAPSPLATVDPGTTLPASGDTAVPVDTLLRIGFDAAPTLGASGTIAIHKSSDGSIVDTIKLEDPYLTYSNKVVCRFVGGSCVDLNTTKANLIGGNAEQVRMVNYVPVGISGNTAVIFPHNYKLAYNTQYYVTMDAGVLTGKRGGSDFAGIANNSTWTFTTKAVQPATYNVAANNTKDFATVQGAIDAIAKGSSAAITINIDPGVYQEMLFIRGKKNISFQGSGTGVDTVIQYDNSDSFNPAVGANFAPTTLGTAPGSPPTIAAATTSVSGGGRAVLLISSSTQLGFDGITLKNTHAQGVVLSATTGTYDGTYSPSPQAETMYFNGNATATLIAKRSNFVSYPDTVQLKGFNWFYDCFLTGDVDFIWGAANTALFERCELQSRANPNGGYVVNARNYAPDTAGASHPTSLTNAYAGFVFLNSAFTREDATVSAFLARSQGPLTSGSPYYGYDDVAVINCSMDAHIPQAGWSLATQKSGVTGPNVAPNAVIGWREYRSFTPGGQWVDVSQRLANNTSTTSTGFGSIQLTDANVSTFYPDRATILGGATDGTLSTAGGAGPWNGNGLQLP
jgi:pectin methylesterase-like acyl-CoA thioesterase